MSKVAFLKFFASYNYNSNNYFNDNGWNDNAKLSYPPALSHFAALWTLYHYDSLNNRPRYVPTLSHYGSDNPELS